ncbi:MAG: metallophosphoesterase family protein [Filimonas sp.]|nr:metallophosphoesterase family protein [Filimonas sp.]
MKKYLFFVLCLLVVGNTVSAQTKEKKNKPRRYGFRPEIIRGPYLQMATQTSMMIRWRTDEPDVSQVRFGEVLGKWDQLAGDKIATKEHLVTLTGLKPYTKYYYLVEGVEKDTLQGDELNSFTTLPPVGYETKYRIGVFGDCGNNSVNQRNTRDQFEKYIGNNVLNAWILLGDNAYSFGKDIEYQSNFFNIYKDNLLKRAPLFPAPGNHDYHDEPFSADLAQQSKAVAYYQNFSMPSNGESGGLASGTPAFYSYDIGNIHFLSLDSHGEEDNNSRLYDTLGRQVTWVKKDLAANKNKGWVIAYWHHPPFTMGSHNSDQERQLIKIRENFIRILEREGVDLVLCGHSHSYERSRLMMGHFGMEESFDSAKHLLSNSSALYDGSNNACPYIKDDANKGTVYVVSGSSGALDYAQKAFPHNAMQYSDVSIGGSCILEVEANRLDLKWLCADGTIRDHFTMMKKVNRKTAIKIKAGEATTLTASYIGNYQWSKDDARTKSITVKPSIGKTTYTVSDPYSCIKDTFIVQVTK